MAKKTKPKGLPKTGGRKKGTPNKVTADFRERVLEENFCPIKAAIALYEDFETPHDIKFKCIYFIAEFSYYKPKNPLDVPGNSLPPAPSEDSSALTDEELESAIAKSIPAKKTR